MLSSAKKSVPTLKQFVQPYFIEIAPDGAIMAACPRITNILHKNSIYNYIEKNIIDVFLQLGTLNDEFKPADLSGDKAVRPISFDLSVNKPGARPLTIRWTPTPANTPEDGRRQLTGIKIGIAEPLSTDIVIATDLDGLVMHWNKAAEKCCGISARHAIGRQLGRLISYEYIDATGMK